MIITQSNGQQPTNIFNLPLPIVIKRLSGDSTIIANSNASENGFKIRVEGKIVSLKLDPENWILKNSSVMQDTSLLSSVNKHSINEEVSVFPNPATGYVEIKGLENTKGTIVFYDILGHVILSRQVFGNEIVGIEGLKEGIYFVQIITENGILTKEKLIIL